MATDAERLAIEKQQMNETQKGLQAQKENYEAERSALEKQVYCLIIFVFHFPVFVFSAMF
jgi:hypothetical protein